MAMRRLRANRRRLDLLFILSYPIGIGLFLAARWYSNGIGGSALGGKVVGGEFQVLGEKSASVTGLQWMTDLVLILLAIGFGALMMAGMVYFFIKYVGAYLWSAFRGRDKPL